MLKGKKIRGTAVDSLALTFVQIVTSLLGMVVTKLLSVNFSLTDYGTYSQALLVCNTAKSITIFGLTNATNYFYNNTTDEKKQKEMVSTVFSIQYIVGLLGGFVILLFTVPIANSFDNERLKSLLWLVAFVPLLANLLSMLQVLFVSIGHAKVIALRNFIVSLIRLCGVVVACYITQDIVTILTVSLLSDIAQVVYFLAVFAKKKFLVNPFKANIKFIPEILKFCIPMAIYVSTNSLSRDIGKYVVSMFTDTETLAIYSNASRLLPFDLITSSFITVLIPVITRYMNSENFDKAKETFSAYLRLGYMANWILIAGAVAVSPQLMVFLYDEKYLPGLPVFIIYLFADMIRFANVTAVLVGAGKTRILMSISLVGLALNFILNIFAMQWFGIIGPAAVTLLINLGCAICNLHFSSRCLKTKIHKLFNFKEMGLIVAELIGVGACCVFLCNKFTELGWNYFFILVAGYGMFCLAMLGLNGKKIFGALKEINRFK